jgi:hypothetical protein
VLLDALNRHRGKGQQKVTVEHVHVHSGGQAVVGMVETPGGGAQPPTQLPMHRASKCRARTRERSTVPSASDERVYSKGETVGLPPEFSS